MKRKFKLLTIMALSAFMLTLASCSEEVPGDTTPLDTTENTEPTCYLTTCEDAGSRTFEYNATNQLIKATIEADVINYTYVDNKLSVAEDNNGNKSTFTFDGGDIPSRIDIVENGENAGYILLESTEGNITRIENHDASGTATLLAVVEYEENNPVSLSYQQWDEASKQFQTALEVENIETDGKNNPYRGDFALMFTNLNSPFIFGQSNILSGTVKILGNDTPITGTHEYNEKDFPTSSNLASGVYSATYTYDCK